MHDRQQAVVWRFGRLLGPVVVALLCGASTARAETPRHLDSTSPIAAAQAWGPLHFGGRTLAARQSVQPPGVKRAPLLVGARPARPRAIATASGGTTGGAHLGQVCQSDAQCVDKNTICERRRCVRIKRTINVMWLFYRSADRRYTSVLGLYHHNRGNPGLHILAPLYFHVWSKFSDTRVVLPPLFVQHRNRVKKSTDTFVLNFHHHTSTEAVGFNIWPILFAKKYRKKKGFSFSLIPLMHYSRRGKAWSMYFLLFPPWYVSKRPGKTTWAVFPFAAGTTTKHRSLTWMLPLSFYWRRGSRRHYLFFPLYYGSSTRRSTTSLLVPLYWYRARGKHYRQFISPLLVYGHNRRARRWHLWWTVPPILFTRRPGRSRSMVLPFFYHHRFTGTDERMLALPFLASYFYRRGNVRQGMVGPLHYHRGAWRSHTVVFPLFWHFKNHLSGRSLTVAGNVFLSKDRTSYTGGALPLIYFGKNRHGSHQIFLPIFWNMRDHKQRSITTQVLNGYFWRRKDSFGHGFLPFYWYERRYSSHGHVSSKLGILPLLYHTNDRRSRLLLTPLGGYFHDRDAQRKTLVVGNVFWHRRPGRTVWGVFPVLWHFRRPGHASTVVFPLYWRLRPRGGWKTDLVLPLFGLFRKQKRSVVVVGPAYYDARPGARSFGLAPLLFVRAGRRLSYGYVFPLIWHRQDHVRREGYTVVGPAFNIRRPNGHTSGVFPLVWWGREGRARHGVAFPLFWYFHNARRGTRTVVAGPVFHHRNRSSVYGGVVPAVFWHADQKKRSYTVWSGPILYRQRRERVFGMVAPLFFFTRQNPHRWSVTALPLFHYRKNRHRQHLWTPLFGFGMNRREESRYGYVGPVGWSKSPIANAQVVFPLFWRFANKRMDTTTVAVPPLYFGHRDGKDRTDVVPPVFVHRKRGPKRAVVLFPLLFSFSNSRLDSRTVVTLPFYYWRRRQTSGGGLIPLIFVRRGPRGATDVTVVPLVHVRRRRHSLRVLTPLFGFGSNRRRGRSFGYVGPVGWSSSPTRSTHVVFPLFWHHNTRRARTVVALPLFVGRYVHGGSSWSAAVPIFYHRYNARTREHSVVVPPGLYVRRGPNRTNVALLPLFWHSSSPGRSTTVAFPLYWDFKRGHRRHTVLFPLVWRIASRHKTHTVVLNTYYGRDREKGTYRLLILPLLEVARKRPGDIKVGFLGGLLGYERIGRNRYLKLFFARIRLKPLPAQPGPGRQPLRQVPSRTGFFPI